MSTSEIATVLAWHDALSAGDIDTLVELSSDDIEIGDAHGAGQGLDALRAWAQNVGETLTVGRMYVHDGVVVVEQTAQSDDGADPLTDTSTGALAKASAFRVVHDHVTSVFRHTDLASALAATDLTEGDLDA